MVFEIQKKNIIEKYFFDNTKELKIYDIGCGLGRTTFELKKMFPNSKIEAIDINKIFINNCKKRNSDNSILFKHKNIIEKINEKEKYDLILFSFNGLTNILEEEEVRMALNNIYNLLKKGGKFIFTIHDMFSTEEYKNYWLEKVKVYDLELFSEKKSSIK